LKIFIHFFIFEFLESLYYVSFQKYLFKKYEFIGDRVILIMSGHNNQMYIYIKIDNKKV